MEVSFRFETRYELLEEVGRGGMGIVHRAVERSTGRPLAVKFFRGSLFEDDVVRRRFEDEARILAELSRTVANPNLVRVLGFGQEPSGPYIAFEWVEGTTLRSHLQHEPLVTLAPVLRLVDGMCFGLSALHQGQVVHLDLKPANVMVTGDGAVKIIDLGVALDRKNRRGLESDDEDVILGTPVYMSPEQCTGGDVSYRSDLYSLGVVFYELVVGSPPFWGSASQVVRKHLDDPPKPPSQRGVQLPSEVEDLVLGLLEKDPRRRPSSAVVVRTTLQRLLRTVDAEIPVADEARRRAEVSSQAETPRRVVRPGGLTRINRKISAGREFVGGGNQEEREPALSSHRTRSRVVPWWAFLIVLLWAIVMTIFVMAYR